MKRLPVLCAESVGREVLEITPANKAAATAWAHVGVLKNDLSDDRRTGTQAVRSTLTDPITDAALTSAAALIPIDSPSFCAQLDHKHPRTTSGSRVHPDDTMNSDLALGLGSTVAPGWPLRTSIIAGRHLQVDQDAAADRDILGRHVRLNPPSWVSHGLRADDRTLVGASAALLQGRKLSQDVVAAAGSSVTRGVPEGSGVKGVSAR